MPSPPADTHESHAHVPPLSDAAARSVLAQRRRHRHHEDIGPLWQPRFAIGPDHRIATFGSCFAQHIGRAPRRHGFSWIDGEPATTVFSDEVERAYGYGLFSARTGNICTAANLAAVGALGAAQNRDAGGRLARRRPHP